MPPADKATGWKVPLLFCCAILALVAVGAVFTRREPPRPELPGPLVRKAAAMTVEVTDKAWKERIVSSASGFSSHEEKDRNLSRVVDEALHSVNFDAACTAVVLVRQDNVRDTLFRSIFDKALEDCQTLPWAVVAVRGVAAEQAARNMADVLARQWEACEKKGAQATPDAVHESAGSGGSAGCGDSGGSGGPGDS